MIPVKQSKLFCKDAIHNGNCYAAAFASLLELPLWMVPPFEDMFGRNDWYNRADEWLRKFFHAELVKIPGEELSELPDYYMACGPSSRGVRHAVIHSGGKMVHDPHPSNDGISKVESCEFIRSLSKKNDELEKLLKDFRIAEKQYNTPFNGDIDSGNLYFYASKFAEIIEKNK